MKYVLVLLCLLYYQSYNYSSDSPPFSKYFKVGFIPYKDKQESDIIFWFYHEGMRTSCGLLPSYIGLYRVRSQTSFIEYLKKYENSNKTKNVYEMTRSAYAEYMKTEEAAASFCGNFKEDVQDEVIKIYKENGKIRLPEEVVALYKQFVESTEKQKKSIKYKEFVREYLQKIDYEGTFICILPDNAKKFFNEVEEKYQKKAKKGYNKL